MIKTFENLIDALETDTIDNIIRQNTNIAVDVNGKEVYDDDRLTKFLDWLGAEIMDYCGGYALIKTLNDNFYEVPYEERPNRFEADLPNELVLTFDKNRVLDVSEYYAVNEFEQTE